MIVKFLEFINESISNNIVIDSIEFGITEEELGEIFVDLMDELDNIDYNIESFDFYRTIISIEELNNTNSFVLCFENTIGIMDPDKHMSNDYLLHNEEGTIYKHLDTIEAKLELYGLRVALSDFGMNDNEYIIVISKI